jgi:predicted membrane-bound mannosyltransferase
VASVEPTGAATATLSSAGLQLQEPASGVRSWARTLPASVSYEGAAFLLLIGLAILTRFWDLGGKTLHHDESLHTYYSWLFATGQGYRHDPLMHGPFLFHANALVYLIFGDSDATSRYMPAFFGVLLVALPYLLRGPRHLGRWGALACSLFFLISPAIMYQSRYIRHDIYTVVGAIFLFICLVRYIELPQRRWLIAGAATISFLLTNHEIVFALLVIFFGFLYAAFFLERLRVWWPVNRRVAYGTIGVHVAYVVLLLLLVVIVPADRRHELLEIPWENPTPAQESEYHRMFITNPLVVGFIALTIGFVIALAFTLNKARNRDSGGGWLDSILGDAPIGTVSAGVREGWRDKNGLLLAFGAALAVFVPLYTSMFTNMHGLRTATIATDGTLLYWLGQHDVQRGEQPWFYFLLLMPQYEYLAVFFGTIMSLVVAVIGLRALFGRPTGPTFFFRSFLVVWFVLIFGGLSYAGEKMPWLVVHISLPATMIAAAMVGAIMERALALARRESVDGSVRFGPARIDWAYGAALLALGLAWILLAAHVTFGEFAPDQAGNRGGWRRVPDAFALDNWWSLAVPVVAALLLIAGWSVWRGARRAAFGAIAACVIGLSILQVQAAWRLSFTYPDIPKEMMVYTQTSPDVSRTMEEITQLSYELTGSKNLELWYDSGVTWPFQWYLRDFPNKRFVGASITEAPQTPAVILAANELGGQSAQLLANYTAQPYVLRWWFPEETYRGFAIAPELPPGRSAWQSADEPHGPVAIVESIGDTLADQLHMDHQQRLYRLWFYRDLDWRIGQTGYRLYIRNDLIPYFNGIRY